MAQETVQVLKDHDAQINKLGTNGTTPQGSATVRAAVVTTAATNSSPFGFATQAQADNIVTLINQLRAALVANGIAV